MLSHSAEKLGFLEKAVNLTLVGEKGIAKDNSDSFVS